MSFILDALKKSESDRQEKSTPDISDVPTAKPATKTSMGAWYLVGFLSLAVVVLLAALLRPAKGPAPMVSQELPLPSRRAAEVRPPPASPPPDLPAAAEPAPVAQTPSSAAPPLPAAEPPAAAETAPAEAATEAAPSPSVSAESYLTFNDLRASGNIDLPDLHIDLHVFSEQPADRFVFINMNQYRENATLSEGPRLREITSEGVLLEYVGTTFLLPRE